MGKRESYEPGIFSWVELSTSDAEGAKAFYGELFGWEFEDNEVPGGGMYTMCYVEGDVVAGMMQQNEQPGHWNNYVSVANADEMTAKAKELGAEVFAEPFDVMDAGRMAVFADPGGATLCVWQPQDHAGAGRVNDPGCLGWNELQSREPEAAAAFYSGLFGWETEPVEQDGKLVYMTIRNKGWPNGGIMPLSEQHGDASAFWLPYFIVESCDASATKARKLGGKVMAGPMEPGGGRIAVLSDPQGVAFAIFEGETDE